MSKKDGLNFNPFASESEADYQQMSRFRAECPIAELDGGVQYVANYDGVKKVLEHCEKFEGSFGTTGEILEELTHIAATPEPRHGQIRRIINSVIAPHRTMGVEGFVRDLAKGLLADFIAESQESYTDIIERFSDPIPSTVIAYVLGFPLEHREQFQRWSDELLEIMGEDDTANRPLVELHPELTGYVQSAIDERRKSGDLQSDVIGRFISTEIDGVKLSDPAICTQTIFLILSGNETTRNLLGSCLHLLSDNPEIFNDLKSSPERIPAFVEEVLRYGSPVKFLSRTCRVGMNLEGQQISPEDRLILGINSANRDLKYYGHSEDFDYKRQNAPRHLAFGVGAHICPGAFLARLEAVATIEETVKALNGLELKPGYEYVPTPTVWAHGPREVWVKALI